MPIPYSRTKKARALKVIQMLERGPANLDPSSFGMICAGTTKEQREELLREYKIWVKSWIIPELQDLVPQLKEKDVPSE